MTTSPNLGLPYLAAAQAQKHVTHNQALDVLDALVQLAVRDRDLSSPPGSPADGQRWIVAASPSGAWAGHATHIACWRDGGWQFSVPAVGWVAYVVDEGTLVAWNGSAWGDFFATVTALQNLARLGVGTTADATNPLSAKLNNTLFAAKTVAEGGDGHLRYKLSKESAAKTLSLLLQTNFSGRAEIGLTGDDDFHFKVSGDGSAWSDALLLKASSGQAQFAPTTDATAANAAAATFAGGVGIAKKLYAGDAIRAAAGSAGAPAFSFSGDADTGLWSPAGDALGWSLGGAERMRLDATGLGLGTGAPDRPLHIESGVVGVGAYQLVLEGAPNAYGAGLAMVSRTAAAGTRVPMAKITADGIAAWSTTTSTQTAALNFATTTNGTLANRMSVDSAALAPAADNTLNCGAAASRWAVVYAATGTINTSDAADKSNVAALDAAAVAAWARVAPKRFQWNDAIARKGAEGARLHVGWIAQEVAAAFAAEGLDAWRYAPLCRDNLGTPEAPDWRYGLRHDQCLMLEAAYLRGRADALEQRLAALEAHLGL